MTVEPWPRRARMARTAVAPLTASARSTKTVPTARAAGPTRGHCARSARLTMCPPNARSSTSTSAADRWLDTTRCPRPWIGAGPRERTPTPKMRRRVLAQAPTHASRLASRFAPPSVSDATASRARKAGSITAVRAPKPATRATRRISRRGFTTASAGRTTPTRSRAARGTALATRRGRRAWPGRGRARTRSARGGRRAGLARRG